MSQIYTNIQSQRGSLLIEALLSVMILSLSITLIIQAMTASLRASVYAAEYTLALIHLENKMTEAFYKGSIDESENDASESHAFDNFQFNISQEALGDEHYEYLSGVDMQVTWERGTRKNNLEISTFIVNASQ